MQGSSARHVDRIWSSILPRLDAYAHDHYRGYPSRRECGWIDLLHQRLTAHQGDPESQLFFVCDEQGQTLICLKVRSWDQEHFGFELGSIEILFSEGSNEACRDCLRKVLSSCKEQGLRFVSARINGDQLEAIHALEEKGFRYFEDIIWPVADCRKETADISQLGVRLLDDEDIESVAAIAQCNQYQRGHYHCDPKFPRDRADLLYARWVRTAHAQHRPILLIEDDGKAAGYFVLDLPENVSAALGYRYGAMRSLGVSAAARGKGLGRRLFRGAVAWFRDQGCDFVDSGYATKNHLSARLHHGAGFNSVYEEITMHLWLR